VVTPQRGLQRRALPVAGELGQFAAQCFDLRGPVQAQEPAQVGGPDPGRGLGAGFAQQRQEHPHQQRGAQPVEALAHRREDLGGDRQQPGHLQRRQRQQQPGQRQLRALGDHHRRLDQVPEPGRDPVGGAWQRRGEHHQVSDLGAVLGLVDVVVGLDRRLTAWGDPAQRDPHRRGRHPGSCGDLQQRLTRGIEAGDPPRQGGGELDRALGAGSRTDQGEHTTGGEVPPPRPQRHAADRERGSHLLRRRDPGRHQLHRRQPAAHLIAGPVAKRGQPEDEHQATVRALQQASRGTNRTCLGRQQRKHSLDREAPVPAGLPRRRRPTGGGSSPSSTAPKAGTPSPGPCSTANADNYASATEKDKKTNSAPSDWSSTPSSCGTPATKTPRSPTYAIAVTTSVTTTYDASHPWAATTSPPRPLPVQQRTPHSRTAPTTTRTHQADLSASPHMGLAHDPAALLLRPRSRWPRPVAQPTTQSALFRLALGSQIARSSKLEETASPRAVRSRGPVDRG